MSRPVEARPGVGGSRRFDGSRGVTLVEALVAVGVIVLLIALLLPAIRTTGGPGVMRAQCKNNLQNIMLALNSYVEVHGVLPPATTVDAAGRPLHSWRTLILPYMELSDLYESIDLTKPWDDPANAKALATPPALFCCPTREPSGMTTYLAVVGEDACLLSTRPRSPEEITDGLASTLLLIDVNNEAAIPWMVPRDADAAMVAKLGMDEARKHTGGANVGFADGSVRFLKATTPASTWRAITTIAGGEPLDSDDL